MSKDTYTGSKRTGTKTPQTQPIPGKESRMIKNSAGGYTFSVDDMAHLNRFLILGTAGGTYYANEQTLTKDALKFVEKMCSKYGEAVVDEAVRVSEDGLAMKNDPALVALAIAACSGNKVVVQKAMDGLQKVARTGTHLLHFASFIDSRRGWGRAVRGGIADWMYSKNTSELAFQMSKYRNRDGWTWTDVIRLAHVKPTSHEMNNLFKFIMGKEGVIHDALPGIARALYLVGRADNVSDVVSIIKEYKTPMEIVPSNFKSNPEVWGAALPGLGLTAILRNLGNMTRYGVFENEESLDYVLSLMSNQTVIKKSRMHPITALVAKLVYDSGKGMKGKGTWNTIPAISYAADRLVMDSFKYAEPTGKKFLVAQDVSGSMGWENLMGVEGLDSYTAGAVISLALTNAENEGDVSTYFFSTSLSRANIKKGMSVSDAVNLAQRASHGGTDTSKLFKYALDKKLFADAFITITDNETWAGNQHASSVMEEYRKKINPQAKSIVLATTATPNTINDPFDENNLDICGFSADVPLVVSKFVGSKEEPNEGDLVDLSEDSE